MVYSYYASGIGNKNLNSAITFHEICTLWLTLVAYRQDRKFDPPSTALRLGTAFPFTVCWSCVGTANPGKNCIVPDSFTVPILFVE